MNKNIITPVDLIQTLREAADSLDEAADDIDCGDSYGKEYRTRATAIRGLIKEYET